MLMSPKSKIDPVFRQEILHAPPDNKAWSDVELNSVILRRGSDVVLKCIILTKTKVKPVEHGQSDSCARLKLGAVIPKR